jgi:hypothetical protein
LPAKSICHDKNNVLSPPGLRLGENGSRDAEEHKSIGRAAWDPFHSFP